MKLIWWLYPLPVGWFRLLGSALLPPDLPLPPELLLSDSAPVSTDNIRAILIEDIVAVWAVAAVEEIKKRFSESWKEEDSDQLLRCKYCQLTEHSRSRLALMTSVITNSLVLRHVVSSKHLFGIFDTLLSFHSVTMLWNTRIIHDHLPLTIAFMSSILWLMQFTTCHLNVYLICTPKFENFHKIC